MESESSLSSEDRSSDAGASVSNPSVSNLSPSSSSTNIPSRFSHNGKCASTDPLDGLRPTVCGPQKDARQITFLFMVIALVWCLFSVPVVLYHVKSYESPKDTSQGSVSPSGVCEPYNSQNGDICTPILQQLQQCLLPESATPVTMVSPQQENQEMTSNSFQSFLLSLRLLGASQDCINAATPFACQYLFPLCNSTSEPILPSAEECMHLSDGVCAEVWQRALQIPDVLEQLPNCNELPSSSNVPACEVTLNSTSSTPSNIQCRDEFFLQNATCIPRCDSWEQDPHNVALALDVIQLAGASVSILGTVALIVISCVRRRSMLSFPAILIVYMTISFTIAAMFILIAIAARDKLYCGGSPETSVVDVIANPTPFCTIGGVVLHYTFLNVALWWFINVSLIFWSLMFPFHFRRYQQYKHRIHISLVIVGLLIPIPGIIPTLAKDGYITSRFPPTLCAGTKDPNILYYSVLLPTNVFATAGLTMIIAMIWRLYRNRSKQQNQGSYTHTAEKKLLFVFTYYTIYVIVLLIYFALLAGDRSDRVNAARQYFLCEAPGHNPNNPCPKDYEQYSHPWFTAATHILQGLLPLVNLIYVVPWRDVRNFCKSHFSCCWC